MEAQTDESPAPVAAGNGAEKEHGEALDRDYSKVDEETLHEQMRNGDRAAQDEILRRDAAVAFDQGDQEPDQAERKSASTTLVEIALDRYTFGQSTTGETFAIPRSGPRVVAMLRGSKTSLRGQLARVYFQTRGKAASQQALSDAMAVLEGMAQEADPRELYLRVAQHDDALWLDLGDATGRAIRIDGSGWTVEDTVPVLFKRTSLNTALPEPEHGDLDELWGWVNTPASDRPLILAYLVAALYSNAPHPVLGLFGEQGCAKSTTTKVIVSLIDPSPVPIRKAPRDAEAWVTAAAGSWMVGLDNLSDINAWLSDSLCRAVTGEGDVRRRLYTDAEHQVFSFRRCLILNSIDAGALRGDLAERMLPVHLEPIPEDHRLAEEELWPAWHEAHPRLLGAVLDLAARVARVKPEVSLPSKPRMADFAKVVAAVDRVLGGDGLSRYLSKQRSLATDTLTGDSFVMAITTKITDFEGSSADLLDYLHPAEGRLPRDWPSNARAATQRIHRYAPALRKAGWTVEDDGGQNHRNVVLWTLRHPEKAGISSSPASQPRSTGPSASHARQARHDCRQSQDDDPWLDEYDAGEAGSGGERERIANAIGARPVNPEAVIALLSGDDIHDLRQGAMPAEALEHMIQRAGGAA